VRHIAGARTGGNRFFGPDRHLYVISCSRRLVRRQPHEGGSAPGLRPPPGYFSQKERAGLVLLSGANIPGVSAARARGQRPLPPSSSRVPVARQSGPAKARGEQTALHPGPHPPR
jgi:hypothetical protein